MIELVSHIGQIIFADVILSGDNALVIGMAAAGLSPELRQTAIVLGLGLAAMLRILFAAMATYLLAIPGMLFLGGALLAWVCWRFYAEIREQVPAVAEHVTAQPGYQGPARRTLPAALCTIALADVSMSIDNVVAVAAIARNDVVLLVFGLALAIGFMALCANCVMQIMIRFAWLAWAGLAFLIYLAARMLIDGWPEVAALAAEAW